MHLNHPRAIALAAALILATTSIAACGADASDSEETITFAAIPAESSVSLEQTFGNITKLIEQETGAKVEFQNASDYAAVIEGMRAGQVDIGSFGPFSYVIAKDSGVNIEPIAAPTNDKGVAPAYTSLAYVRGDSEIASLDDLRGRTVCFVDQASTSGYLVPMKGLMDADISMEDDIQAILAGGHDASLLSLSSGECDVAFAHDAMLTTLETSGQVEKGALRPIWESEEIPEDPLTVNKSTLSPELAEKITAVIRDKANKPALVEAGICESEEDCVLPEETEYGYIAVEDTDFDSIRELCDVTQAEACQQVG